MMKRIMDYINSGKQQGARVHLGGERHGKEGYWIQPTIFTDTRPDMRIVKEEIFGPVGVVIKFEDEEDVLRQANDTMYGLAAAVFTKDIMRGIKFAHKLHAGTAWVNCINSLHPNVPFGGYKQSGVGRELGEYALNKCVRVLSYLVRGRLIPCAVSLTPATPTSKPFTSTLANVSERRNREKKGGTLHGQVENMR
jgi:aldehyde dehydrogenase (NAD+)